MNSFSQCRHAVLTLLVALTGATSSCIYSPREPYVDRAETPSDREKVIVRTNFPRAKFTSPVYRKQMDSRSGYVIVSRVFLFDDKNGKPYRGEIGTDSSFTPSPVKYVTKLPEKLKRRFFGDPAALVPGGRMNGRGWVFSQEGDPVYEFVFSSEAGGGFGRIAESQKWMSAYHWR